MHVTTWFLPIKMTLNELSSVKTGDGRISDVQSEDNDLNSALPLIYFLSFYPDFALIFIVLYFSLCCVCSSTYRADGSFVSVISVQCYFPES